MIEKIGRLKPLIIRMVLVIPFLYLDSYFKTVGFFFIIFLIIVLAYDTNKYWVSVSRIRRTILIVSVYFIFASFEPNIVWLKSLFLEIGTSMLLLVFLELYLLRENDTSEEPQYKIYKKLLKVEKMVKKLQEKDKPQKEENQIVNRV
jgi:predicted CDP-diglyceride synthetase/phosphatidate cytidylyltransferase